MQQLSSRRSALVHAIPIMILLGCAASTRPRALHPEFSRERVRPLVLLMDIALAHDVAGDIDELRVYEGRSIADSLSARLTVDLEAKRYRVERSMLTSMGLYFAPTWEFLTLTSAAQESLATTVKPKKNPPFFTNDSVARDTMLLALVGSMYREARWARARKVTKKPPRLVESAPLVREYLKEDQDRDLLVVLVAGRDIGRGKKAGRLLLTMSAIALGAAGGTTIIPFWDNGGVMVDAFIIDGRTGDLLWSDSKSDGGARANWPTVSAMAGRVIAELP